MQTLKFSCDKKKIYGKFQNMLVSINFTIGKSILTNTYFFDTVIDYENYLKDDISLFLIDMTKKG